MTEREDALLQGSWPANDLRRAFVQGAAWWEFESRKATMWASDRHLAEAEAERRYGGAACPAPVAENTFEGHRLDCHKISNGSRGERYLSADACTCGAAT